MVAVGDKINVYSTRHKSFTDGTVVQEQNANGYWGVVYADGSFAMKALNDWDVVNEPAEQPSESPFDNNEYSQVISTNFVVVVNDTEATEFGDDELEASRFMIRALRSGDSARLFEKTVTESYRVVDPQ